MAKGGLGPAKLEEAAVLYENGIMGLKQLAMRYGVSVSTMSKAMRKMGVRRGAMAGDRREAWAATHSKTFAQVEAERREASLKLVGGMMKAIIDADAAGDLSQGFDMIDRLSDARGIKRAKRKLS